MSAVLSASNIEVLPPRTQVANAVKGPGQTVIDAETGTVTYEHKSPTLLMAEAERSFTEAKDMVPLIDCAPMYAEAGDLLQRITGAHKTLDEERLAATAPLRQKVDDLNADYKPAIERLKEAAETLKSGMLAFTREVERQRQQAEREAQARAAEERRRAEAEARAAREKAEADAAAARKVAEEKAAEERRIAEEAAAKKRAEAEALAAAGDRERAAQLQSEASEIVTAADESVQNTLFAGEQAAAEVRAQGEMLAESHVAVSTMITPSFEAPARPRASGVTTRKVYAAECIDPKTFFEYCLKNWDTMNHYWSLEGSKLNKLASDQKERFNLPGCELRIGDSMASRRK